LTFSPSAISYLTECNFPGNIRELENYVLRAATFANGDVIVDEDFSCLNDDNLSALWSYSQPPPAAHFNFTPLPIRPTSKNGPGAAPGALPDEAQIAAASPAGASGDGHSRHATNAPQSDREKIIHAMEQAGWVKAKAARLLDLTPRQVGYALIKYDIELKKL
jgi:Nif-specific regulatory protein